MAIDILNNRIINENDATYPGIPAIEEPSETPISAVGLPDMGGCGPACEQPDCFDKAGKTVLDL